jgi:outer membrane protein OmpU
MKKSLYSTTALVAAGVMTLGVSGAMAAEKINPVKLGISGYMKALIGYGDQSGSFVNTGTDTTRDGYDGFNQLTDSEIHFTGGTKLDNGITVGVHVELETDQVDAAIIDHSYLSLSGNFGTVRLGSGASITALLSKSGGNVGAIPLTNGDTNNWVVAPAAITGVNVSTNNASNDAMKIVYMTPTLFGGLVVGANYTASETNLNSAPLVGGDGGTELQTFAGSAAYTTKFNSATIAADVGYWASKGPAATSTTNWRGGLKVGFGPWTIGTSRKETNDDKLIDANANDTYDAALSWKGGDWTIGVQMVNSTAELTKEISGDDEVTKYSIGAVYNMGPGIDLVGTIAHVNFDDEAQNTTANNNTGMAAVGGVSVKF